MKRASRHSRYLARRCAVQALYQWDLTEQDPHKIEDHFIAEHDLSDTDFAYFRTLIENIPLYHQELDANLSDYLDREIESVDPVEKAILRIGAYELEYQHDIPFKVVIYEAVELSKTFGAEHGYQFVNAVLDGLKERLRPETEEDPE
ncbi:MAG: transcription antitermination factor NusB [Acidiferrobacteraceae bacterium]|jgi:N utilization substance protein B|nr:transcription antitermination factor NusB [Acidiferrobacteraceae bacterium]MDP6435292.1 transcription antitermination factor NusB [Arenicellales bacterium]MBT59877.1 transcription antitermination factor NusB [Acidiferrobacteraceae bacterium]MDP6671659.1 transcription antitermination factor NusB [Arenicellales bacterium]MDP6724447.1 transcription antitermination factor NusB [Arenicellales bacterium]|tara:strand:+ start:781 stop:1221 length:441 start_codon:yes stop_codon:yes gene_type:complete